MIPLRLLQHVVVFSFLLVTLVAFVFTMCKVFIPVVPYSFMYWSYGMMAPYQGDTDWNGDVLAEGQLPDGTWHVVSLDPYLPYGSGEKNVRKFLRTYQKLGPLGHREKFTQWALLLLGHERAQGRNYQAIRFTFEKWPRSTGGFEFLRRSPFVEKQYITEVRL